MVVPMKFTKENNNPNKNKTGDCVVRAISKATENSWIKVYDDLTVLGRELKAMPNDDMTYREYLKGYKMIVPKVEKGKKRLKVFDFDNNGTYVLSLAGHLTTMKEGVLYDTWDCRGKAVYRYWIIKGDVVLK